MILTLERQNSYRNRYARANPGWEPATELYEALIRAAVRPGMHILDLGCGRGGVLEQLGDMVSFPIGFDPDPQSLIEHRLPGLPRAVALADTLPLRASSIDCIVCSWVLEHVTKPKRVFSEIARCLRPNGLFIFLTPNARAIVTLLNRFLRPVQHVLVPRLYGRAEVDTFPVLYRANTQATLDRLAQSVGLVPETFRSIPDPTYLAFNPILYRASVLLSRVTPPVHLVGVYRRATSP